MDCLPGPGMLANIGSETRSTGGAPANVLADLARMIAAGEPLSLAIPTVNLVSQRDANDRALVTGVARNLLIRLL